MRSLVDVMILRIFLGEASLRKSIPVSTLIVHEAIKRGMAGATVTRGMMGFGAHGLLRTSRILRLAENLPIIVEIVDRPERIKDFLPYVDAIADKGTITVEYAQAIFHMPLRVRDIVRTEVVTVTLATPLSEVGDLLLRRQVPAVPVLENALVRGMITEGSFRQRIGIALCREIEQISSPEQLAQRIKCLDSEGLTAKDVMTTPVRGINSKTSLEEAFRSMERDEWAVFPVVDDDGLFMGLVSRSDTRQAQRRACTACP